MKILQFLFAVITITFVTIVATSYSAVSPRPTAEYDPHKGRRELRPPLYVADSTRFIDVTPFSVRLDLREHVVTHSKGYGIQRHTYADTKPFRFSEFAPGEWRVAYLAAWGGMPEQENFRYYDGRPITSQLSSRLKHDYCRVQAFRSAMEYALLKFKHKTVYMQIAPLNPKNYNTDADCFDHAKPIVYINHQDQVFRAAENFMKAAAWMDGAILNAEDRGKAVESLRDHQRYTPITGLIMIISPSGRLVAYIPNTNDGRVGWDVYQVATQIISAVTSDPEWDSTLPLPVAKDLDHFERLEWGDPSGESRHIGSFSRGFYEYFKTAAGSLNADNKKRLEDIYRQRLDDELFRSIMTAHSDAQQ